MKQIEPIRSFTYAGVNFSVYHANKNEGLNRHEHLYNHLTICHSGSCLVSLEEKNYTINKDNNPLDLPANKWHEIKALEDNTVFVNVFAEGKY